MVSGRLFTHPALARRRFSEIAHRRDDELDLTEASLIIALEEYPELDLDRYVGQLDRWSTTVRERLEGSRDAERMLAAINQLLFEEEGFSGEGSDYFEPRDTFLNEVLDRHSGQPIALSIVFLEVSRRVGLPASAVSLPGKFLVRASGPWGDLLIDPDDAGRTLTTAECQQLLDQLFGGAVRFREHHLRSYSNREVLARLLSQLKSGYLSRRDLSRAASTVERILMLDDDDAFELRDRGILAIQMHQYSDAIVALERYIGLMPQAEDVGRIREEIAWLRAWMEN